MLVLCWGVECRKHGHVCSHILSAHQFNAPGLQRNRVTELKQRIKLFGFRNISEPFTLIQLCRNLQPEQELWGNCSLPSPAARYAILFSVEMFIRICAVGPVAYFCSTGLVKPPGRIFGCVSPLKVGWSFSNFEKWYFLLFPGKCLIGEYPYPDIAWVHSGNNG